MVSSNRTDDGNDRDFLQRIEGVRWRMTLPRPSYEIYRRSLQLALVPFRRVARRWFLKRFAVGLLLVIMLEVAAQLYWDPYVILFYGSQRFGSFYRGGGDTLALFLLLGWLIALALAAFITQVRTSRALRALYEAGVQGDWRQELSFGEQGLLLDAHDARTLFRWEALHSLTCEKDHWFLAFSTPIITLAIPAACIAVLPDSEAFLGFLRGKAGRGASGPAPDA
jgi:hypothetical protein